MSKKSAQKVLVVDMPGSNRDISVSTLESEDYQVHIANDSEEALNIIVEQHPDIIVTNVLLPKVSGFDMIDIIKSVPEIKDIPVIILCGLTEQIDIDRGKKVGAAEYLIYPEATPGDLIAAVKRNLKK